MARLSDIIEEFIKDLLKNNDEHIIEIQRNELANKFSCAPSQINYVLTTRFTKEKGYYIESRRGGGGCIKITRVEYKYSNQIIDAIEEKMSNSITYESAIGILESLEDNGLITDREKSIIKVALNDRTLNYGGNFKNKLRADILKAILLSILS